MAKSKIYARVIDGAVAEVLPPGAKLSAYSPEFQAECVICPADVLPGWTYDGKTFSAPATGVDNETRKAAILARLDEIDALSVRPLRAIRRGRDTEADHSRLDALDAEADALRDELRTLQG